MPSLHNPTADALDIPALGLTMHSGETISVTDEEAEGFVGHGVLELITAAKKPAATEETS